MFLTEQLVFILKTEKIGKEKREGKAGENSAKVRKAKMS